MIHEVRALQAISDLQAQVSELVVLLRQMRAIYSVSHLEESHSPVVRKLLAEIERVVGPPLEESQIAKGEK
jgi:hypothetical protein